MLALVEEILLLALDDDSGKLSSFSAPYMHIAIAGAIISELTIQKKIKIVNKDKKKSTIEIEDESPSNFKILDDAFTLIKVNEKKNTVFIILQKLANKYKYIRSDLYEGLTQRRIIKREEKMRLKIFKKVNHPIIKPNIKNDILSKIQEIILDDIEPSERMVYLLAIIGETNMIGAIFSKGYRKIAKNKIKAIIKSDKIGIELKSIISAIESSITLFVASIAVATS